MILCSIGAAWRLGGFEIVTRTKRKERRERHAYKRIYFLSVSGLLSEKEEKHKGGLFYFVHIFSLKKKSLKWICTRVEDNWGFLLFVLGIETKKWRL